MFAASLGVDIASSVRTESGVYYRDIREGSGDQPAAADQVTITYAGYLKDGTLFDSRSTPTQLTLAATVQGFRDGIVGMRPTVSLIPRTGVIPIYARTPANMAQSFATLDDLSGGRAIAGLGVSHKPVVEHWYGQSIDMPSSGTLRSHPPNTGIQ